MTSVFGVHHDATLGPNSVELSLIIAGIPMAFFYL